MPGENESRVDQLLASTRQWLRDVRGGTPASGATERELAAESTESATGGTRDATGFVEGLAKNDVPDETGLTPQEYIRRGLRRHDGQLRQQAICELTGWSQATVSRTLTQMEEEEQISRVSVGREKIVCLPDVPLAEELAR